MLTIVGAKFRLIDRFGSDLPFWDQWDAEGDSLLRPYLEHRLTAQALLEPHNEHRILLTRLLVLGLFEANDRQWDARLEMAVNAFLDAAAAVLFTAFLLRLLPLPAAVGLAAVTALLFAGCVSYENTLGGFQSQFYLMMLLAALHLGGTFLAPPRSWAWWLAPLAGLAGLFAMASGLLSAAVILGALLLRLIRDRDFDRDDCYVIGVNLFLLAGGWLLRAPPTGALAGGGISPIALSWWHELAWPMGSAWSGLLNFLPLPLLVLAWLRGRVTGRPALVLLAGGAWYWLQAAAIAYARGAIEHGTHYSSRYTDLTIMGVLLNLAIIAHLAVAAKPGKPRRIGWAVLVVVTGLELWGYSMQKERIWAAEILPLPPINDARVAAVRGYVAQSDQAFLRKQPWTELPYPSATRLAMLLDDPTLRPILPASVRPPLDLVADPASGPDFVPFLSQDPALAVPHGLSAWESGKDPAGPAHFLSSPFVTDHSQLSLYVLGTASAEAVTLRATDNAGQSHEPRNGSFLPSAHWTRVNLVVPAGPIRLEITVKSGWLAFTQPFTTTALSRWTEKWVREGTYLLIVGLLAGLAGSARLVIGAMGRQKGGQPCPS